jgi:cytochrome d ubiquinol oxidase subunit I
MAAVAGAGAVVLLRRRALTPRYLRILTGMTFTGWLGTVTGWHVAEQGRQPWLIQGYLRVHDAGASPASPVGEAFIALALLVYLAAVLGFVRALYRLATCAPPSSPRSPAA